MDGRIDGFFSVTEQTPKTKVKEILFFFCFTPKPSVTSLYFSPLLLFCKLRIIYVGQSPACYIALKKNGLTT